MATDVTNPLYFRMHYNNTVVSSYKRSDSGAIQVGWYDRDTGHGYVKEILMAIDVSGIPSGSTINSVDIVIDVDANSLPASPGGTNLYVAEQDLGSWTDTGSAPVYDTFSVNNPWPRLKTITDVNTTTWAVGDRTISSNASMVSLWQDFVDGVKTDSHGIVIGMDTATAVYFVTVGGVTINVDYTEGGGGSSQGNFFLCM